MTEPIRRSSGWRRRVNWSSRRTRPRGELIDVPGRRAGPRGAINSWVKPPSAKVDAHPAFGEHHVEVTAASRVGRPKRPDPRARRRSRGWRRRTRSGSRCARRPCQDRRCWECPPASVRGNLLLAAIGLYVVAAMDPTSCRADHWCRAGRVVTRGTTALTAVMVSRADSTGTLIGVWHVRHRQCLLIGQESHRCSRHARGLR